MNRRSATFEEFWGELLLVRFHGDGSDFLRYNEQRAEWALDKLSSQTGRPTRILDLGCGSGVLDICLAQKGAIVTGVDRISSVLDIARERSATESIQFLHQDLRHVTFPPASFDLILMLGLVGLMSKEDDANLIARAGGWLSASGRLLVDCPLEPTEHSNRWQKTIEDGVLDFRSGYDPHTRIQHLTPEFTVADKEIVELVDIYDKEKPGSATATGVLRYLYPIEELTQMMVNTHLLVSETDHPSKADHYALVGH